MARSVGMADRSGLSPEILEWARNAPWEALACRDVRHAWPADLKSLLWGEEIFQMRRVWVRRAACMHGCGVTRVQRKDQITRETKTSLDYPKPEDGKRSEYLLPLGLGRLNADEIFRLNQMIASASAPAEAEAKPAGRKSAKPAKPAFSEKTMKRAG